MVWTFLDQDVMSLRARNSGMDKISCSEIPSEAERELSEVSDSRALVVYVGLCGRNTLGNTMFGSTGRYEGRWAILCNSSHWSVAL